MRIRLLLAIVAVLAVGAIVAATGGFASTPSPAPSATPADGTLRFSGAAGDVFEPSVTPANVALSAEQAVQIGFHGQALLPGITVRYGTLTMTKNGIAHQTPVYAVIGGQCEATLGIPPGPAGPGAPPSMPGPGCQYVSFLDATTGEMIVAENYVPPES